MIDTVWLGAQVDADERVAHAARELIARHLPGADVELLGRWTAVKRTATGTFVITCDQHGREVEVCPTYGETSAAYIAHQDPARVLAEVAAKRRTITRYTDALAEAAKAREGYQSCGVIAELNRAHTWDNIASIRADAIRDIGTVYSDRPGYAEWLAQ